MQIICNNGAIVVVVVVVVIRLRLIFFDEETELDYAVCILVLPKTRAQSRFHLRQLIKINRVNSLLCLKSIYKIQTFFQCHKRSINMVDETWENLFLATKTYFWGWLRRCFYPDPFVFDKLVLQRLVVQKIDAVWKIRFDRNRSNVVSILQTLETKCGFFVFQSISKFLMTTRCRSVYLQIA